MIILNSARQAVLLCLCASVVMLMGGCVPIRQYVGGGPVHSQPTPGKGGSVTEYQSPDGFKNLGKDAWKGEMEGIASWYGEDFNGRLTASGEVYDMYQMT